MSRKWLLMALAAVLFLSWAAPAQALDRSTSDRPDDVSGAQVHFVYVLPADGVDRQLDVSGAIAASGQRINTYMAGQMNGASLRLDTYHGELDVSFLRLSFTAAQGRLMGFGLGPAVFQAMMNAGFNSPTKKYIAFYEDGGTSAFVGQAQHAGAEAFIQLGANDFPGQVGNTGATWSDLVALHEIFHELGAVPTSAPHYNGSTGAHVSDDPRDLMYGEAPDQDTAIIDPGHDDYYSFILSSPFVTLNNFPTLSLNAIGNGTLSTSPDSVPTVFAAASAQKDCTGKCDLLFDLGTVVSVFANPAYGQTVFGGWATPSACASKLTCEITMNGPQTVTGTFVPAIGLTVKTTVKADRIAGTYKSPNLPAQKLATCNKACKTFVAGNTMFKLTLTVGKGRHFVKWTGCASKTRVCSTTVTKAKAVTAVTAKNKKK